MQTLSTLDDLTCVTLSKESFERSLPSNIEYHNFCSTITSEKELRNSFIHSLLGVKTTFAFLCDTDDELPQALCLPEHGIVYGDFLYSFYGQTKEIKSGPWNEDISIANPFLIHRPIFRVSDILDVALRLPNEEYFFFHLLYHFTAKYYGAKYNPDLRITWNKKIHGLHLNSLKAKAETIRWLRNHRELK